MKPEIIETLNKNLVLALEEDNKPSISIEKAAKLLGMDDQTLRISIANGSSPIGIGGRHERTGSKFGRVSKLALWNYLTKGIEN